MWAIFVVRGGVGGGGFTALNILNDDRVLFEVRSPIR